MGLKKYNRSIALMCPTCGGTQFEDADQAESSPVRCVSCKRSFLKSDLVQENNEVIQSEFEQIKSEVMSDIKSQLKKQSRNSKFIKIR